MNKRILLFSRDPGGANTIFPLIEPIKQAGFDPLLYGKDTSLDIYKKYGYMGKDITEYIESLDYPSIEKFIIKQNPHLVITGTSGNDFTERYIWKATEYLKIPCYAILDQWINYGIRFSAYSTNELEKYESKREHPYLPSVIFVMDSFAYEQMKKSGVNPDKIIISGQPYFDFLNQTMKKMNKSQSNSFRKFYGCCENDILVTFASEPISDTYENAQKIWGFDEKVIFTTLISGLNEVLDDYHKNIKLIIRNHPKEKSTKFLEVIRKLRFHDRISIKIDSSLSSINSIIASDLIIGMSSMFLIEAAYLKKPVMSILIGLKKENPFILGRIGYLKSITLYNDLITQLKNYFEGKKSSIMDLNLNHNSIEFIIKYIVDNNCQN